MFVVNAMANGFFLTLYVWENVQSVVCEFALPHGVMVLAANINVCIFI